MKLTKLETHDRLEHFTKQDFDIGACCQNLIDQRPFGNVPFYIFAHTRTDEDGVTKRLIWQPRLTKPKADTNSMLFKAYPGSDTIKVIWMIPAREMWSQYRKGVLLQNKTVYESIENFTHRKEELEAPEIDDLSDEQIYQIYLGLAQQANLKRATSEVFQASLPSPQ